MTFKPHPREALYFGLRIFFSVVTLLLIVLIAGSVSAAHAQTEQEAAAPSMASTIIIFVTYIGLILLFFWFQHFILMGHLRGSGVKITERQFPDVYAMIREISSEYGIKKEPSVFLIQEGGLLNAFATRFSGKNYVALYSEVFSMLHKDAEVLKFVLAHEMAHVRRGHVRKRFWTFLSFWVPFLGSAYSRSCEYTCDLYGAHISKQGATKGLVFLAAGRELYDQVDLAEYLDQAKKEYTSGVEFAEKFVSHPYLANRLRALSLGS